GGRGVGVRWGGPEAGEGGGRPGRLSGAHVPPPVDLVGQRPRTYGIWSSKGDLMSTSRSLWSWIALGSIVFLTDLGRATPLDPALLCRAARYRAAARYLDCQETAFVRDVNPSTLVIGGVSVRSNTAAAKCRRKYQTTFAKMAAVSGGAPLCSGSRFLDTGSGTISDKLTGLEWEQK